MRLFTATLATETNTFSPMPTSLDSYRESEFFRPGEHPTDAPRMCTAPLFVGRARAKQEGFKCWIDPSIRLGHVGAYTYTMEDLLRPSKLSAKPLQLTRAEDGSLETLEL